jgi:hypothetical protein
MMPYILLSAEQQQQSVLNAACKGASEFRSFLLLRTLEDIKRYVFDSRVLMAAADIVLSRWENNGLPRA